jgi:NADP-dependent 3-hydroxy acid dehydrogenase YdfG
MSLEGKLVWITGAGSGIGQSAAVELAQAGATVVASGRRASALAETEGLVRRVGGKSGGKVEAVAVDVADREAVREAGEGILRRHGRVDILVNSAGLNVPNRFFRNVTAKDWDHVVGVNVNGAMYCMLAVLPSMRERRDGLVINISSWFGRYPSYMGGPAYNASKQALATITNQLNLEEGHRGIRGCVIFPGEVATPILKTRPTPVSAEDQARMLKAEDLGRLIRFVAESPAHVCMNEIVISPTWNRLIIGGADITLAPTPD